MYFLQESFDSTTFDRLINNIRVHCKRNANPPLPVFSIEQQPNMTTVETSVRKIPIPSRKISLTCQNVQVPFKNTDTPITNTSSITTIKSPPNSHRRHLLTTSSSLPSSFTHCKSKKTKKTGSHFADTSKNRLKSPLPSPIVSPLASPSRSRFQVSKVNEPKMSCSSVELSPSPTFFPSSRFSVTRVTQLAPQSSNLLTPSSASSTLSDSALSSSSTSLDSIDHHMNVSMSSTDSFDFILRNVPVIEAKYTKFPDDSKIQKDSGKKEVSKLNDSLSSLEISVSSQDSLNLSQKEQVSRKVSSNEGTLTNSPCKSPDSDAVDVPKSKTNEKRTRKNSWINVSKGESNYPATLDKLLSLFQPTNISQIFNRSSPDSQKKEESVGQTKRENTVGNLFAMVGLGTKKESPENIDIQFKPNILQQNQCSDITFLEHTVPVDNLPNELKREVKENISPDNTITASSVSNLKPLLSPVLLRQVEEPAVQQKVIFELGGEDQDEISSTNTMQSDPLQNLTDTSTVMLQSLSKDPNEYMNTPLTEYSKINQICLTGFGLGNIARDSLSIIKGGANTSQDSMRSLDSLPEFEQYDSNSDILKQTINPLEPLNAVANHEANKDLSQMEVETNSDQLKDDEITIKENDIQKISTVYY